MDGIAKALNTEYVPEPKESIKDYKEIQTLSEKLNEVKTLDPIIPLEDKKYLKLELMEVIQSVQDMRRFLQEQIQKPPIRASEVEAYAMVVRELKDSIKELRVLNMDIVNTELALMRMNKAANQAITNVQNNVYMLDSKALDKMIDDAQKNRAIDDVEINFEEDDQTVSQNIEKSKF